MNYTAVIRTLGTAGEKYQKLLDSLCAQTLQPREIIVYIADGYPNPKETCGRERYVTVKKGMVAQRALPYDEVDTEYILFLDDDVYLPKDGVERLFDELNKNNADVISPDVFPNHERPLLSEIMMTLSGRMRARRLDRKWGYKVMKTCGYSYNKYPKAGAYFSQTNAGPCFFCRKDTFLKVHFEDELWLDKTSYPMGEDQIMFYKMHLMGLKVMTLYDSKIRHLDAGSTLVNLDKEKKMVEADYFFRTVFWDRFIQSPESNAIKRLWNKVCINYFFGFGLVMSRFKGDKEMLAIKKQAIAKGREFLTSEEYRNLPKIEKK